MATGPRCLAKDSVPRRRLRVMIIMVQIPMAQKDKGLATVDAGSKADSPAHGQHSKGPKAP